MDATGSYHREIVRHLDEKQRDSITTPLMRLQDPDYTKIVVVTLPETTPILEAEQLTTDLARAQITPWAWVVNNSLLAAHPTSPLLARRAAAEATQIERVRMHGDRLAIIPSQIQEPVGRQALEQLTTRSC